jgi:uncharacterized protein
VTVLLDANVLIALLVDDHVHHAAAENWFAGLDGNFATCPATQGSLLCLLIPEGQPATTARAILAGTSAHPQHEFWPDDLPYTEVPVQGIIGHPRSPTPTWLSSRGPAEPGSPPSTR